MDLFDIGKWDDGGTSKKLTKQLCQKGVAIKKSDEYLQLVQSSLGQTNLSSASKQRKTDRKKDGSPQKLKTVHFLDDQDKGKQTKKNFKDGLETVSKSPKNDRNKYKNFDKSSSDIFGKKGSFKKKCGDDDASNGQSEMIDKKEKKKKKKANSSGVLNLEKVTENGGVIEDTDDTNTSPAKIKKKKRKKSVDSPQSDQSGDDSITEKLSDTEKSPEKKKKKRNKTGVHDISETADEMSVSVAKKRKQVENSDGVDSKKQRLESSEDSDSTLSKKKHRRKKKKNRDKNKYKHLIGQKSTTSQFHLVTSAESTKTNVIHSPISSKETSVSPVMSCDSPISNSQNKKDKKFKDKKSKKSKLKRNVNSSPSNDNVQKHHLKSKERTASFDISKLKSVLDSEKEATSKIDDTRVSKGVANSSKEKSMEEAEDKTKSTSDDLTRTAVKSVSPKPLSLAEKMKEQLRASRFRYLNEQLYTRTGSEAFSLMQKDPEAFKVYHAGFQSQVTKWPENPVDRVVDHVKKLGPSVVVADFGCGDAKLAKSVSNKVHSFDLIAVNKFVTACDMANVPLGNGSVDVAVFCLALMGTNLTDFIAEASRVLKKSGVLLVAEVVSRFEKVGSFVSKMAKMGFTLKDKDSSNKMFIWFEFVKTGKPTKDHIPQIELAPCIYKRR